MQISTQTLLASQQAAALQPRPTPGFSAALEKTEGFAPLPLKQAAPVRESQTAQPVPTPFARLGAMIDIKV
jgi:hypothetical protein